MTSKRDLREERTFDRAVDLFDSHPEDIGEVRRQLQAEAAKRKGRPGEDLDMVSDPLLRSWWEQGLVRQVRLRGVIIKPPIKETIADRQRSTREKTRARVPRTFDRASELLKQHPGQFDRVAGLLGSEQKAKDLEPVDAAELRAWWARGLQDPARPPISDTVQNHIALREEQADSEAQTLRRDLKTQAARNGISAVFTLAIEQEQIRRLRLEMAGHGQKDRVGLDKVAISLMRGIADDLDGAELSPEKKYDWLMRILKLQQALISAQSSVVQTEALIGGGDRTMILGLSMGAMPPGSQDGGASAADGDSISVGDLRQRALEVAGYMEDLDRLPEGLENAVEVELSQP